MGLQCLTHFEVEIVGLGEIHFLVGDGQRARLVGDEHIHLAQVLEGGSVLHENLFLCGLAYAHHQRCRCGQSQGTRTGNDKYRNCRKDGLWQMVIAAHYIPHKERYQCDARHHRHKDECCPIDDTLHGRFRALCLLDHADDMCQSRLLTNLSGTHRELPLAGDGAGQNLRAFSFFGRSGFACDHAFVHIGGIGGHETLGFDYITIHGHLLARSYFEQIALLDGRNGHFAYDGRFDDVAGCVALGLLLNDMCGLGCHAHQLADGTCRAVFRLLFEQSSGEHKGENHHRSVEVGMPFDASASPNCFAEKCVERAEKEGDARRERHESVHTRSSMSYLLPRIAVEVPSADYHAKQRQHERNDIVR